MNTYAYDMQGVISQSSVSQVEHCDTQRYTNRLRRRLIPWMDLMGMFVEVGTTTAEIVVDTNDGMFDGPTLTEPKAVIHNDYDTVYEDGFSEYFKWNSPDDEFVDYMNENGWEQGEEDMNEDGIFEWQRQINGETQFLDLTSPTVDQTTWDAVADLHTGWEEHLFEHASTLNADDAWNFIIKHELFDISGAAIWATLALPVILFYAALIAHCKQEDNKWLVVGMVSCFVIAGGAVMLSLNVVNQSIVNQAIDNNIYLDSIDLKLSIIIMAVGVLVYAIATVLACLKKK